MCIYIYIHILAMITNIYIYIYIYIYIHTLYTQVHYGQFSEFQVCFCGLDPGNLKFETVRTNMQHMCF